MQRGEAGWISDGEIVGKRPQKTRDVLPSARPKPAHHSRWNEIRQPSISWKHESTELLQDVEAFPASEALPSRFAALLCTVQGRIGHCHWSLHRLYQRRCRRPRPRRRDRLDPASVAPIHITFLFPRHLATTLIRSPRMDDTIVRPEASSHFKQFLTGRADA